MRPLTVTFTSSAYNHLNNSRDSRSRNNFRNLVRQAIQGRTEHQARTQTIDIVAGSSLNTTLRHPPRQGQNNTIMYEFWTNDLVGVFHCGPGSSQNRANRAQQKRLNNTLYTRDELRRRLSVGGSDTLRHLNITNINRLTGIQLRDLKPLNNETLEKILDRILLDKKIYTQLREFGNSENQLLNLTLEDRRNALIVEINKHTLKPIGKLQGYNDAELLIFWNERGKPALPVRHHQVVMQSMPETKSKLSYARLFKPASNKPKLPKKDQKEKENVHLIRSSL